MGKRYSGDWTGEWGRRVDTNKIHCIQAQNVKEQTKEILKVVKGLQSTFTCSADPGKDVTVYHELNAA